MSIEISDFSEAVERIHVTTDKERDQIRLTGLGASEAAVVMGLSPWQSPLSLYYQKRGEIPSQFENKQMAMGKKLEALVVEMYAEETQMTVYPNEDIFRLKRKPHIYATPDALLTGFNGGVEAKTAVYAGAKKWDEEVPVYYQAQAQVQMFVMDWDWVDFPVLKSGIDFEIYRVERDSATILSIEAALDLFWDRIQEGRPPSADGHEATSAALSALYGSTDPDSVLECDPAVLEIIESLERIKGMQKDLEESREFFENHLKSILGSKEIGLIEGKKAFSWKSQERTTLDVAELRRRFPRATKKYEKVTRSRTFRLHKMEGK